MEFTELTREEALNKACRKHAVHCMLYCLGNHVQDKAVMMQLRFDGSFGFTGGYVDNVETWEQALNRELLEEVGFDAVRHPVAPNHYVYSAYQKTDNLCEHFYCMEITFDEFRTTEKRAFDAEHFGTETMGLIRVPLWDLSKGRGLPTFLCNRFVGNARQQLIRGLKLSKVLKEDQIDKAVKQAEKMQ